MYFVCISYKCVCVCVHITKLKQYQMANCNQSHKSAKETKNWTEKKNTWKIEGDEFQLLQILDSFDLPDFGITILTGWDNCFVVQPNDSGDLWLRMSILNCRALGRIGHRPNDNGCVQRTAGHHLRVGRPGHTIDFSIMEAPFLLMSRL